MSIEVNTQLIQEMLDATSKASAAVSLVETLVQELDYYLDLTAHDATVPQIQGLIAQSTMLTDVVVGTCSPNLEHLRMVLTDLGTLLSEPS